MTMIYRVLIVVLVALALASCKTVEVYHFIHEKTEVDRKSLQWSLPNPHLTSEVTNISQPYFVVDFYRFWPAYSATAYLYVVQDGIDPIELKSISVTSAETGESQTIKLDIESSPRPLKAGIYLYRYRVLEGATSSTFSEAESLKVVVKWSEKGQAEKVTKFELKKQLKSEAAWPT